MAGTLDLSQGVRLTPHFLEIFLDVKNQSCLEYLVRGVQKNEEEYRDMDDDNHIGNGGHVPCGGDLTELADFTNVPKHLHQADEECALATKSKRGTKKTEEE